MADVNGGQIPGGGAPAPGGNDNNPAPAPSAAPSATPTGGTPAPGGAPAKKVFTYEEDRTDWRPAHRFNEESTKRQAAERRAAELEATLEAERKRVRALAGLETPSAEESQRKEVKNLILEMFPELGEISTLKEQNQTALTQAQQAQVAHWERHSTAMIADLEQEVASALGVEKLTERQSKLLRQAYTQEAQDAVSARFVNMGGQWVLKEGYDFSNDFMSKHERGDKAHLKEFAKAYVGEWFEPARRQVTSQAVRRNRPVPSGARSGQPVSKTPEINYNDENAFKQALINARRGGGSE